jgi:Domain of unknown function (DUF6457)
MSLPAGNLAHITTRRARSVRASSVAAVDDREWVSRFAAALGIDAPTPEEFEGLLALAGTAAHASARTAAPVSCWVAARAGVSVDEARRVAETITG